jgi:hypothetical protein
MIRNIIVILTLALLTSCEYDYIHYNPDHPEGYLGNWMCDSTLPKGMEKRNFSIMQTEVKITSAVDIHQYDTYADWKVDELETTLILIDGNGIEAFAYEIIRRPYKLALKDKFTQTIYYLHR